MILKKKLRSECLHFLKSIPLEQQKKAAQSVTDNLTSAAIWKETACILAYMALPGELNTEPVLKAAWQTNKLVFIPQICAQNIIFRRIHSLARVNPGNFGIREPDSQSTAWNIQSCPGPTLVLVPGLAFDKSGNRLGRGGGFYDRFLRQIRDAPRSVGLSAPLCMAFCYEKQIIPDIPVEPWDEKMDGLLTDSRFCLFFEDR